MSTRQIRNVAIIAHVDHGKTTLVDQLLKQSGTFRENQVVSERVMDSNDLEKERGITILAKNTAIRYEGYHINIVDTPGHADFGGEVERVLSMVDGVVLLVDAVEGPMPQTLFVTKKALSHGFAPLLVVNKVDRPGASPDRAVDQTFDLFCRLGASEEQLDFPIVYASALQGWAIADLKDARDDGMRALFDMIVAHVPPPTGEVTEPFQLQIAALDYSSYVGRIGIGRVSRGRMTPGQPVAVLMPDQEAPVMQKIAALYGFQGLERIPLTEASAGDIIQVEGLDTLAIGATLCHPDCLEALPVVPVDQPTLSMQFMVNNSPFAGQEGKFLTSRHLRARLLKETLTNISLKVEEMPDHESFMVSGRGELHLSILIENMRREGYELMAGRPRVIKKMIEGVEYEPYELLTADIEESMQGVVVEALGKRKGQLLSIETSDGGRYRLEYRVPTRGLIGFYSEFVFMTRGTGLLSHVFDSYDVADASALQTRHRGVLISQETGKSVAYALWKLQERGRLFVLPGERVYEGMIIGVHTRDNDLVVNPIREKKLTNIRADGKDEHIDLIPIESLTLEKAIAFIQDDELIEVTPQSLRLRKYHLTDNDRRRAQRAG